VGVWEKSESKNYIPFGDVVKNQYHIFLAVSQQQLEQVELVCVRRDHDLLNVGRRRPLVDAGPGVSRKNSILKFFAILIFKQLQAFFKKNN
jgi:hypothetical protein